MNSPSPQSYSTVTLAYEGPVARLTLNRPDKRNAISYELIADLLRALQEVESCARLNPDPHRRWQGVLLGHGPRQPACDYGPHRR